MSIPTKERIGFVIDSRGIRPFEDRDLPAIGGFLLYGQSLGDILCMTPMVEAALQVLGNPLDVWTWRHEIFQYHPRVKARAPEPPALAEYLASGKCLFVAPTGTVKDAFENHLVETHSAGIVELAATEKRIVLHSSESERVAIRERLVCLPHGRKRVLIHPSVNHAIRTYPQERWIEIARALVEENVVISVGRDLVYHTLRKHPFEIPIAHPNFHDWTNQLSLHQLYELIRASDLVITFDSGVLHVASATETPVVAIFSDVDPAFRLGFDAQGNLGTRTTVVSSPCEFQFCSSRFGYNDDRCRTEKTAYMQCLPAAAAVVAAARKILSA